MPFLKIKLQKIIINITEVNKKLRRIPKKPMIIIRIAKIAHPLAIVNEQISAVLSEDLFLTIIFPKK